MDDKDLEWLNKKYPGYDFKTRKEWYIYVVHKKKGATLRQDQPVDNNNTRAKKNTGAGSTDLPPHGHTDTGPYKKYIPPRLDMEKIFDFNYNDMLNCEPNKKFIKLNSLIFQHRFFNDEKQEQYNRFVEIYNELNNEELEKINYIYQRLSSYIIKNKLSRKFVDGSIICNIALMTRKYIDTGEIDTSIDFFNKVEDDEYMDELNQFHLFLIRNCFISKNRFFHKYINGDPVKNWWAVCKLAHRHSDKDMKTKSLSEPFRNDIGKIIYKIY